MRKATSKEERLAIIIGDYISDLRFDLELSGHYLAWYLPNVSFRRAMILLESAEAEREDTHDRDYIRE